MPGPAPTPQLAIRRLEEMSPDIRAAIVLGGHDEPAACSLGDPAAARGMAELVVRLYEAAGDPPPAQIEAAVETGSVYASHERGWTVAIVTERSALPSLMLYDIRAVTAGLEAA